MMTMKNTGKEKGSQGIEIGEWGIGDGTWEMRRG